MSKSTTATIDQNKGYITIDYSPWQSVISTPKPYKAHQPGMFNYNCDGKLINAYIKEVIYNKPATIVLWSDGTKTVTKCAKGDRYSKEVGLTLCILKKVAGATKLHDIFENWLTEEKRITLSDVRRNSR